MQYIKCNNGSNNNDDSNNCHKATIITIHTRNAQNINISSSKVITSPIHSAKENGENYLFIAL